MGETKLDLDYNTNPLPAQEPLNSGPSRSSGLLGGTSRGTNSFKHQQFPSKKKVERFYRMYRGLDDRFWNGYLDPEDSAQNVDFFEATDDPIGVANKYRQPVKRVRDMVLPFQTRQELRAYYSLQETKDCGVLPENKLECFRLKLKGP